MSIVYELADFDSHEPFKCTVRHIGHIRPHMHDFLEIIFVLTGNCTILIENQMHQLTEGDIILIESPIQHELISSNCVYASFQLDQNAIENNFPIPIHPEFRCSSLEPGHEPEFNQLRHLLAKIIKNNADQQTGYELRNWIYVYQLMELLYMHFQVESSPATLKKQHRYNSRIAEISQIIKTHFREDLPLSRVANTVHLSAPYLSKFFQEQFGMNYLSYLTQFRLNSAVHELINSDKNIEEISANNGFPNSHAFTQAFKKEYGVRPSSYRRSQKNQKTDQQYYALEQHDYMASLKKYLRPTENNKAESAPTLASSGSFSLKNTGKQLRHTWRNVISIGKASDLLISDIQNILRQVQKEIHYQHIYFNGILSDDLHVCFSDKNGKLVFNFSYIDKILDFLIEIGLKPFLQFTYMPRALAKNPEHILLGHLISEPDDLQSWCTLIDAFMKHIISRYQISEILQWKFSVWYQPNTPPRLFGFAKPDIFYDFYRATYKTVKSYDSSICFGTPAFYYLDTPEQDQWYTNYFQWCTEHNCKPDFINFVYYDTVLADKRNKSKSTFGFINSMTLNDQSDGVRCFIRHLRHQLESWNCKKTPIFVSEWNNTPSQQDLLNDTCYKSCYITKTILDNYDMTESLSYWALSDLMSEAPLPESMLFGGTGLFTVNGLPKSSYYALYLLRHLGDQFLAKGECWYATRTPADIRIIAYHYRHYSKLYAMGERFEMTETERYTMFEPAQQQKLSLTIHDTSAEKYLVKEYILNRKSGSLFDMWVNSGAIDPTSQEELNLLHARTVPDVHRYYINSSEQTLTIDLSMELLEVRLLIISPAM